jgi:hypothetical protein
MGMASNDLDWTCGDAALDRLVHEQVLLLAEAVGVAPSRVAAAIGTRPADGVPSVPPRGA